MVVKTSPRIIWQSFHWEVGLCFCPLKFGLCECVSDRVKGMLCRSELGLEKWAVSVLVCWILIFGIQPPCSEEAQAVQGPIPGLGRSPGEGKGYPLQYSGLENPMGCIVRGVAKSQTRLSDFHFQISFQAVLGEAPLKRKWGSWLAPTELPADNHYHLSSHRKGLLWK